MGHSLKLLDRRAGSAGGPCAKAESLLEHLERLHSCPDSHAHTFDVGVAPRPGFRAGSVRDKARTRLPCARLDGLALCNSQRGPSAFYPRDLLPDCQHCHQGRRRWVKAFVHLCNVSFFPTRML